MHKAKMKDSVIKGRNSICKANLDMAFTCARCFLFVLTAWCWVAAPMPAEGHAGEDVECPAYIWIACGEQIRQPNGSVTQRYLLRNSGETWPQCGHGPQWQAYYRIGTGISSGDGYDRAPILCAEGHRYLDINCRTNGRLELVVVGRCGRKHFMAQTLHPLFGKASPDKKEDLAPLNTLPPDLRRLRLQPSRHNYYMQTGETYRFTYSGSAAAVSSLAILEEHRHLPVDLSMAPDGTFAHTPAHDPRLDRSSPYDFKETVVLIQEAAAEKEYATTFTLLLHRSYTAHLRLLPGLVVLCMAAATVLGLVVAYKRRPWYC